jgi:uncharacterized membrane protein
MFCQYKNIFGEPGKGVHAYRLFDIAIVDVVLTVILGIIIAHVFSRSLIYILIGLFLLSIIMHRIFCVRTRVDRFLFGN